MPLTRLRLVFDDPSLLGSFFESECSNRCWFLLDEEAYEISDVATDIISRFDLEELCPHGVILLMDDFVLPELESSLLLKDKDIVRVKKRVRECIFDANRIGEGRRIQQGSESVGKLPARGVEPVAEDELAKEGGVKKSDGAQKNVDRIGHESKSRRESVSVGKQPVTGVEPLAREEFENEKGGYESESEDDEGDSSDDELSLESPPIEKAVSKKRKSSKKIQSKKKKKAKKSKHDEVAVDDADIDIYTNVAVDHDVVLPKKTSRKKSRQSKTGNEVAIDDTENVAEEHDVVQPEKTSRKKSRPSETVGKLEIASGTKVNDSINNNTETVVTEKGDDRPKETGTQNVEISPGSEGTKKLPSRSARRKKAKRQWLRELANSQKEEIQSHLPEKTLQKRSSEPRQADLETTMEDEIVPIVVKPGHIRFEPLDEDEDVQQRHDHVESFQWNGTTSKKKGQKWGMEKTSAPRSNDYRNSREDFMERLTVEEPKIVHAPIDFEKLKPFSILPKEGNVLAYRVVELSSSWCPELSPFRVGKVLRYDSESKKVVLVPVPEYPVFSDEMTDEAETPQPDPSLYGEDGSLEIDFTSLVDVRIFDPDSSGPPTVVVTAGCGEAQVSTRAVSNVGINEDSVARTPQKLANGGSVDVWEELSQALTEKKTLLSQKTSWNKKDGSSTKSWSYRALRSSALGPTMALLRSGTGTGTRTGTGDVL